MTNRQLLSDLSLIWLNISNFRNFRSTMTDYAASATTVHLNGFFYFLFDFRIIDIGFISDFRLIGSASTVTKLFFSIFFFFYASVRWSSWVRPYDGKSELFYRLNFLINAESSCWRLIPKMPFILWFLNCSTYLRKWQVNTWALSHSCFTIKKFGLTNIHSR